MATEPRKGNSDGAGRGPRLFVCVFGLAATAFVLLCGGCLIRFWHLSDPTRQVAVGPETTVLTGPLTPDGYVNYETALNAELTAGVTPENNAVALLVQAFGPRELTAAGQWGYFQMLGVKRPPETGDYLQNEDAFIRGRHADAADLSDRVIRLQDEAAAAQQRPWTRDQYPDVAALLDVNTAPLELVIQASQRSRYYSPLVSDPAAPSMIGVLLPVEQELRKAARLLTARAMLQLGEGDAAGAWDDLLACHRLSRLAGQSPNLIGNLVAIALDAITCRADQALLASDSLKADQARNCLRDLDALAPLPSMADSIDVGERYMFLDCVQLMARGRTDILSELGAGDDSGDTESTGGGRSLLNAAIDWNVVMQEGNAHYDALVAAMGIPEYAQRSAELSRMADEIRPADGSALLQSFIGRSLVGNREEASRDAARVVVALFSPAAEQARLAEDRAIARFQLTRVGFALAIYRAEHGEYPERLEQLVPGVLTELPSDPFTGQPFVYHKTEDGFRLYSVGDNRQDDGGATFDTDPRGDDLPVIVPLPPAE